MAEGGASPASAGFCEHAGETRGQDPMINIKIMTIEDLKQKIEALAKKAVEGTEVNVIECKVTGRTNDVTIQITADKPFGGITIGECVILNKALGAAIGQEGVLAPGTFSLEVSSPGID